MDLNFRVPTLFAYCEKNCLDFFKNQPGYVPLDGLCFGFFRDFSDFFLKGGLWGKSCRGNIQHFGAQIFSVVWP